MKSPTLPLRKTLEDYAADAREKLAADLFDLVKLKAALARRAKAGFRSLTIGPTEPFNLRETAAARAMEVFLAREKLAHVWRMQTGQAADEADAGGWEIVISWPGGVSR